MQGIDYSDRPAPVSSLIADMDRKGLSFVGRYLSFTSNSGKTPRPDEIAALRAAGKGLYWYFEESETGPLGGFAQGAKDAAKAKARLAALGMPTSTEVYFCCDFQPNAVQLALQVGPYYKGCASVLPLVQVNAYGSLKVCAYLLNKGLVHRANQTMGWSGGQWDARAALRQDAVNLYVGGLNCDHETATTPAYGQVIWGQPAPVPVPTPAPAPTPVPAPVTMPATLSISRLQRLRLVPYTADKVYITGKLAPWKSPVHYVEFRMAEAFPGDGTKITGVYDPHDEADVMKWQKAHGLVPDGKVGDKTWAELLK